ncbi:MAG: hypothetical protein P8Y24_13350 [Gammaproteobacteria bacterium]
MMKLKPLPPFLLLAQLLFSQAIADTRATFENEQIKVRVTTNAPQPISAFYEGRGFQKNMINVLKQQCFVSVFIRNKSDDFIWLDLSQWQFHHVDGKIKRLDRHYWKERWKQMNIPMAHQSTFRWTLLPEELDFYPKEKEGGNIILPRSGKPFNIMARFDTGKNRSGKPILVRFENITCKVDK